MFSLPPLAFAAFVGWLLLFPMGGLPVTGVSVSNPLFAFLLPHAVSLLILGRFGSSVRFAKLSFAATLFTLGITAIYPLVPGAAPVLLPMVGAASACLSIRACSLLRQGGRPLVHACLGLILGNLMLLLGLFVPFPIPVTFTLLSLLLMIPLLSVQRLPVVDTKNHDLFRYLPFVFVYHLVSGIMYGGIAPAFSQMGIGQGGELFFYIVAVGCGVILFRKNREYLLVLGILLAMTSLACFLDLSPWAVTASMYAMQAAAGCMDVFILGYLLSFDNVLEAFGIGNGTVCLGILCGHQLALWIGEPSSVLVMAGCLILTCSVFALYFLGRRHLTPSIAEGLLPTIEPQAVLAPVVESGNQTSDLELPKGMALAEALLSSREWEVFCSVISGNTYKVAAADLCLSESTVKTYMKRIFDKYDVNSKKELLKKVYKD